MKPIKPYHHFGEYHKEPSGLKRLDFIARYIEQDFARKQRRLSVLEVGCGNGNIAISMGSLDLCDIIGLDINSASIKRASDTNPFKHVTFLCGDMSVLDTTAKFDIIICSEVLEHLTDPGDMIQRIKSRLTEDGLLLITIPNGYGPLELRGQFLYWLRTQLLKINFGRSMIDLYRRTRTVTTENIQSSNVGEVGDRHVQFFTLRSIKRLLGHHGLTAIEIRNSNFWLGFGVLWYLLFQRLIQRGSRLFNVLDSLDCKLADKVPHGMAAGWYFALRKS
jgi:2-polyprenyl-3-methyl-5-hydroxy-6-metoxy-1,4-benzoquinol methylase